eukprot:CAMPEP_0204576428 /NCGR_PEP_ID=MMETSP0661-20131031/41755_1 /ASSEMBLY_ACC=CAM_ASM_000606 /TAXON_ID=109239 /ORGANISM="Alexandrium margalefi, Strain AMGDE01CS-322" /LENGTH=397 /DNA_ID=CAMNT_0051585175 /DNA_START=47 /DNA_END=1240 /DNA_ORIENTATION=-
MPNLASALALAACRIAAAAAATPSPLASCGATASPDCVNDMGSCGNACCGAEFPSSLEPTRLLSEITAYLESGGADGLFEYKGGAGGLSLATPDGPWTAILQGTHSTFKKPYVDTVDFAIRMLPQGGSAVRIFSISNVAGALGDMGQNRRTVSLLGRELGLGPMAVLFGCGASPSLPALAETGDMWKAPAPADFSAATRNRQVIEQYFRGVFVSSDFNLNAWLERHVAPDGVFQFCPLTAMNLPGSPYPHCTNAQGKEAYLRYVELDQREFGSTRIANASFAVSPDGLEVFSRYMVTGTLQGKSVPWFDQVMAWTFDSKGQIKRTVFWSDTLYWNHLYKQAAPAAVGQSSIASESPAPRTSWLAAMTPLLALGIFSAGVAVGSRLRPAPKSEPLLAA